MQFLVSASTQASKCLRLSAPQALGFCDLPSSHPPHLSKQLIQYRTLVCQPLVRSKGPFCSASLRELLSLFLLPSADRPACSFPSRRALPAGLCCERGQGLLAGLAVSSMLTAPLTGPRGTMVTQAATLYP